MAFSSDFIVGYPGETDKDFQESLEVIEKVRFASSYSFKYSHGNLQHNHIKYISIYEKSVFRVIFFKTQKFLYIYNITHGNVTILP